MAIESNVDVLDSSSNNEEEKEQINIELNGLRKSLTEKYKILKEKLKELKSATEFQNQFGEQFNSCQQKIQNIGNSFSNIQCNVSSMDTLLGNLGSINSIASKGITNSLSKMNEISDNVNNKTKETIEKLDNEIKILQTEIDNLNDRVSSLERQLAAL